MSQHVTALSVCKI